MALSLKADEDDNGRRLDRILRKVLRDLPLSAIYRLLRTGCVHVDGRTAAKDCRIKAGQTITILDKIDSSCLISPGSFSTDLSADRSDDRSDDRSKSAFIPLPEVLFEGAGLLALNKPAGLPVHGRESLEDLVLTYLKPKTLPSLSFKPGPLHRLDRPSSGIIVFSSNLEGSRVFSSLMKKRMIKKQYLALVEGVIKKTEIWRDEITRDEDQLKSYVINRERRDGGMSTKTALTKVSPVTGNAAFTLILAEIETGRTHQIRAQAASRGHPLLGDKKYGSCGGGFFLHAWRMEFPEENEIPLPRRIEAPLPEKFRKKIIKLFGKDSLYLIV